MNRRGFLSTLLGSTAALALDPERLLWVPGAKTIFVPKAHVFQGTYASYVFPEDVADMWLRQLTIQLDAIGYYEPQHSYTVECNGKKIGVFAIA